tara:strand:+ start:620 stop:1108 length:489 start_codon:yes stop_codon:yes gene_type:complete
MKNYKEEEYTLPKSTTFEEALKTSNKYENITILCATDWTIGSDNMIAKRYVLLRYIHENGNESFHIGSQNLQFPNIFCEKFDTNNDYKIYFIDFNYGGSYFGDVLETFNHVLEEEYKITNYHYVGIKKRLYIYEYMHYSIEEMKLVPKPRKIKYRARPTGQK